MGHLASSAFPFAFRSLQELGPIPLRDASAQSSVDCSLSNTATSTCCNPLSPHGLNVNKDHGISTIPPSATNFWGAKAVAFWCTTYGFNAFDFKSKHTSWSHFTCNFASPNPISSAVFGVSYRKMGYDLNEWFINVTDSAFQLHDESIFKFLNRTFLYNVIVNHRIPRTLSWYETAVWCWRWYRYGYRYLPFRHLATLGRWQWIVCWNEFRKYTNIVPCDIGLVLDTSMVLWFHVRGPGLAFLLFMDSWVGQPGELETKGSCKTGTSRCAGLGRLKCRLVSTAKKDFPEGYSWLFPRYCLSEQWQCDGF